MKEQKRLTRCVARAVAGAFLRDHYRKGPGGTWSADTVRSYLPKGWGATCLTERDCLPMTVDTISQALLKFARPLQSWQVAEAAHRSGDTRRSSTPAATARSGPASDHDGGPTGATSDARKRVILVEDDDAYRYVLARELRANGKLDVVDVCLAMQALDHLDRDPSITDAVVDIRMPVDTLTGLAFARMMRRRNRNSRIVLMTGHTDDLESDDTKQFGAVLFKVSDTRELVAGIHERLGVAAVSSAA